MNEKNPIHWLDQSAVGPEWDELWEAIGMNGNNNLDDERIFLLSTPRSGTGYFCERWRREVEEGDFYLTDLELEIDALAKRIKEGPIKWPKVTIRHPEPFQPTEEVELQNVIDSGIWEIKRLHSEKGEQMTNTFSVVEVVVVNRKTKKVVFTSDYFVVGDGDAQHSMNEQARLVVVAAEDCPGEVRADVGGHVFLVSVIGRWSEKE